MLLLTPTEKEKVLACISYFQKHFEGEMYKYEKQAMMSVERNEELEQCIVKAQEQSDFYRSLVFKLDKHLSTEQIALQEHWTKGDKWVECRTYNIKNIVRFYDDNEDDIVVSVVAEHPYKAMSIAKDWLLSGKAYKVKELISQVQCNETEPTPTGNVLISR